MARNAYIGVVSDVPIYEFENCLEGINLEKWFEVTNGSYYFKQGSVPLVYMYTSNNRGVANSTATTTLKAKYDNTWIGFNYHYSTEANYDKFSITVAGTTIVDNVSGTIDGPISYNCILNAGEEITFTYKKDSSTNSNDDHCYFSMLLISRLIGYETRPAARKVKNIYIGINNVARKIKAGYIGVNGVAKPFYFGPGLHYCGPNAQLSVARQRMASTTVGDYALFAGGNDKATRFNAVDAYNASLTRSIPTVLDTARANFAATTVGNYALFGGGGDGSQQLSSVEAYNRSLTKSLPSDLNQAVYGLAATTVGNYALFGGGGDGSSIVRNSVTAYNASLTRSTPTVLSVGRYNLAATTVGNYALFGGGKKLHSDTDRWCNTVDAYNASLTRSIPTALSVGRYDLAATTVGNYALFAGGHSESSSIDDTVDAYNSSLTRTTLTKMVQGDSELTGTTVGNYAIFGGGDFHYSTTFSIYDGTTLSRTRQYIPGARTRITGATIGNYALLAGGDITLKGAQNTIDILENVI